MLQEFFSSGTAKFNFNKVPFFTRHAWKFPKKIKSFFDIDLLDK